MMARMEQMVRFSCCNSCTTASQHSPTKNLHILHMQSFSGVQRLRIETNCEEGVVFKEHTARRSSVDTGQIYRPESMLAHPREL